MPRTGRPRGFDRDEALGKAMLLFWELGYETASLARLKRAMSGLSTASFYAAFASKEALFAEAVGRYRASHGQVTATLRDPSLPPREAIETALTRSARMQTAIGQHPAGCLIVLGAGGCSPEDAGVAALLAEERARNRAGLLACVERAVASGELPADTDATGLATIFDTFLVGISAQARDGVPFDAFERAVARLMTVWDGSSRAAATRSDSGPI